MWNYRVIEHTYEDGEKWYGIHEVYYEGNNDDHPLAYTSHPIPAVAEVYEGGEVWKESLKWTLEVMLKCLDTPTLTEEDFKTPIP